MPARHPMADQRWIARVKLTCGAFAAFSISSFGLTAEQSHFGYMSNLQGLGYVGYESWGLAFSNALYFTPFEQIGFRWDRPHPGPFNWNVIERSQGVYDFNLPDQYVAQAQTRGLQIFATIWPFTSWDQDYWRSQPGWQPTTGWDADLPDSRYKPHDMAAYSNFVRTLVERYDGDGLADMPGLRYPIRYWEVMNEPETCLHPESPTGFFRGTVADYYEILRVTSDTIRAADTNAVISNGGATGGETDFWQQILTNAGSNYFNLFTWHSLFQPTDMNDLGASVWSRLMSPYGIRSLWMTEFGVMIGQDNCPTERDQAIRLIQGYVQCFAGGADKVFYIMFIQKDDGVVDPVGLRRRPGYYAFQTLISKVDGFTSVATVLPHDGSTIFAYRFLGERQPVYCLWAKTNITLGLSLSSNIISQVKITAGVPDDGATHVTSYYTNAINGIVIVPFSTVAVFLEEAPAIVIQPQPQTAPSGYAVALNVSAIGTAPLCYQWHQDGAPIAGATNAILSIESVCRSDEGAYTCVVSNGAGAVTSTAAGLTVQEPTDPPSAPAALAATKGTDRQAVQLYWTVVTGDTTWATGYRVWRGTNNAEDAARVVGSTEGTFQTNYSDITASARVHYNYWVQATNSAGASGLSPADSGWRLVTAPPGDFDGDGKSDPAVVAGASWYLLPSASGYPFTGPVNLGPGIGIPLTGDFDGDGLSDPVIVVNELWYLWQSGSGYTGDGPYRLAATAGIPVTGDFDGDGRYDPAWVTGTSWTFWLSASSYQATGPYVFAVLGSPLAGDFDGDGKSDPAVVQNGTWYCWLSGSGYQVVGPYYFGSADGMPITGDFDGDGRSDPAMVIDGNWYLWLSGGGYQMNGPFGFWVSDGTPLP